MHQQTSADIILPEDGIVLRDATDIACTRANAKTELDRASVADSVLWLARSGYARHSDGTLDAAVLADAAITIAGIPTDCSARRTISEFESR